MIVYKFKDNILFEINQMSPRRFELRSTGPKPGILSIELRAHIKNTMKTYLNLYLFYQLIRGAT